MIYLSTILGVQFFILKKKLNPNCPNRLMTSIPTGYHIYLLHLNIMTYTQIPSVCLPRVWHKFDKNYIEGIFCELFGPAADGDSCVVRIDLIPKKDRNTGEDFWVVFVHFSELMISSDFLEDFVERINANEEIKIQYNPPWFWKVRKNTGARKEAARTGPRIMSRKDEELLMATQQQILAERTTIQESATETHDCAESGEEEKLTNWEALLKKRRRDGLDPATGVPLSLTPVVPEPAALKRAT